MVGCWMSEGQYGAERREARWKVRRRLCESRMLRRLHARVVEACVESGMLFDC